VIPVSHSFLSLLGHQLAQFSDRPEVRSLVVYVTRSSGDGPPSLVPVGHWPADGRALPAVDGASALRQPAEERRWLPLRDGSVLLGALQVETACGPWPEPLGQRLQAVALTLAEGLRLDLEAQRLRRRLEFQDEQLRLLVHQLRNPLTALRTFGQLLLRRLGKESEVRPLVEGLLEEERQLQRYVDAISDLAPAEALAAAPADPQPLLLPPLLSGPDGQTLEEVLEPLLQRAVATAALQGRPWRGPGCLPPWRGDGGAVAEIIANLLENAFRYSPQATVVGLHAVAGSEATRLTVWDGGPAIDSEERQLIFEKGKRGSRGLPLPGTGLGLALARDLARSLGGDLQLLIPPRAAHPSLPAEGNAFCLSLPPPGRGTGRGPGRGPG
jgi:hypothetical protein